MTLNLTLKISNCHRKKVYGCDRKKKFFYVSGCILNLSEFFQIFSSGGNWPNIWIKLTLGNEGAAMAQNWPRIRVQLLKISRIAHFSHKFRTLSKLHKIGLEMGCFLRNGDRSSKTDAAIEFAGFKNLIPDTSLADLRQKFFCSKIRERVSSWFFSILDDFQKHRD